MKTKIFLSIILSALLMSCSNAFIDLSRDVYNKIPENKRSQIQFYNSSEVHFTYEHSVDDSMDVEKGKLIFIDKDQKKLRILKTHTPGVLSLKDDKYRNEISVQFDNQLSEGIPFSAKDNNVFKMLDEFIFEKKKYRTNNSYCILQVRKKDLYKLEHDEKMYKGVKVGK